MNFQERIAVFQRFGRELRMILDSNPQTESGARLMELMDSVYVRNPWFTPGNVRHRLAGIVHSCEESVLETWLGKYNFNRVVTPKTIAVISAGNIPAAGADDWTHVLIAGHNYIGKLSADDSLLLPAIAEVLIELSPEFKKRIAFTEGKLEKMDAVIATGSNNSARYFEYYFAKYPHVIRKNRNSIAVLDGKESTKELTALGEDIFRYFGLGCRNVTKLFVPKDNVFDPLFESVFHWGDVLMLNRKYMNNYEYNRNIYLMNGEKLLDNNFLVIKRDIGIASPPGVLYFEEYDELDEVLLRLRGDRDLIQCTVSHLPIEGAIRPGMAQNPEPWDYADGFDTLEFVLNL